MPQKPEVTHWFSIDRAADWLRLTYMVRNASDQDVYVTVGSNLATHDRHRPYSLLQEPESTLLVTFQKPPEPPFKEVVAPVLPLCALLPAGETLTEYAEIEVPAHELHGYCNARYPADAPVVLVNKITFALECLPRKGACFADRPKRHPGFFLTHGAGMFIVQGSHALTPPLPVLKRTDDFPRF
jgi:hypothetical protein